MARTRRQRGGAAVGGLTRRKKSRVGGSRRRHRHGGQLQGMQTGVSNMANGVGSGIGNAANKVTGFFSGLWDKTKKAVSGSPTGGRRRKHGGQVVGFDDMWNQPGPAVGGRRRRKH